MGTAGVIMAFWFGQRAGGPAKGGGAEGALNSRPFQGRGSTPNLYRTIPEGETGHSEGYATTFAVGRLILQIVTVTANDSEQRGSLRLYGRAGPWGKLLVSIWPYTVFEWPPLASFDSESDLSSLHARFARGRLGPEPTDWT